jgi:uncharacterized membrane protein
MKTFLIALFFCSQLLDAAMVASKDYKIVNLIALPDSDSTNVRDINNNGQVLGVSRFNATDSSKTFIWDNGEFTILDPGFPLLARRIKEAGHVVGTTGSNKGKFTFLGDIGEGVVQNHEDAFALGINDRGQIIGEIQFEGTFHGFIAEPVKAKKCRKTD